MHGYTLTDLDGITRYALYLDRWHSGDIADRYDTVWHAVVEHILAAETPPTRNELLTAGIKASLRHVRAEMHHRGLSESNPGEKMRGFERYWTAPPSPSAEERTVDRIALHQVLPLLTDLQLQALNAVAAHGDYQTAAHALGVAPGTFWARLDSGRKRIYAAWHEGETPPTTAWRSHNRARVTHPAGKRLTESQVEEIRDRYAAGARQVDLAADMGVGQATISRLLRGESRGTPDEGWPS
jgi:predicted DNA-binding protein (UPF0251 family)